MTITPSKVDWNEAKVARLQDRRLQLVDGDAGTQPVSALHRIDPDHVRGIQMTMLFPRPAASPGGGAGRVGSGIWGIGRETSHRPTVYSLPSPRSRISTVASGRTNVSSASARRIAP